MDINSLLIAIGVAVASSIIGEAVSWYMIYRHEEYKNLVDSISRASKELDQ